MPVMAGRRDQALDTRVQSLAFIDLQVHHRARITGSPVDLAQNRTRASRRPLLEEGRAGCGARHHDRHLKSGLPARPLDERVEIRRDYPAAGTSIPYRL